LNRMGQHDRSSMNGCGTGAFLEVPDGVVL
jgi:hypothetical protein